MTSISREDMETVVSRAVGPGAKIIDHTIEPFCKTKTGIMGNHYILSVTIKSDLSSQLTETLNFFVKMILRNSIVDEWVVLEEVHFLKEIYPLMMQDYQGPRWMPACYLTKPEILVFEDVRAQGFAIRQNTLYDEKFLKSVLASLARFHAASIKLEAKLGQPLNKLYPDSFREKIFTDFGKGGRSNKVAFVTMEWIAKRFGLDVAITPKILDRICELVKPIADSCNVVCHGDLWRSNIMFDNSSTSAPGCLLVDYQMLRYASPAIDLAQLIYVHTTRESRRGSQFTEARMLRHYRQILSEILGPEAPAYEDIWRDYEERRIVGMAYSAMRWPPQVMAARDDFDTLEKWYFESRIELYCRLMDDDPVYESQMREYMDELYAEARRVLV